MKLLKKIAIAGGLVLCAAFTSSVSSAQEETPDDPRAQEARALMEEGVAAAGKGDLDAARDAFKKSLKMYESYDVACNLGIVEFELKLYLDAAQHLDYCLRNFATGENRELLSTVKTKWKETLNYVGAVQISVSSDGARISVDGEPVGTSPIPHRLFLLAGKHTVRAEGNGGVAEQTFTTEKRKTVEVDLVLKRDGSSNATEPDTPGTPLDGTRAKRNWVPAYILGGATVAVFATSMVFRGLAGSSSKKRDDLGSGLSDDGCTGTGAPATCDEIEKYRVRANRQATVADATLIATAVLGAATLGYVLFTVGKNPSQERSQATLFVEQGGVSLSLSGHF